jgi:hemerythrin-like domain-containing protein
MATRARKIPEPIVTLTNEHRYMGLLLETMQERVSGKGLTSPADYYLVQDIARYMHEYPDVVHHPTEDILFERLVLRDPTAKKDVDRLLRDHEKLEHNMEEIVELLDVAFAARTPIANEAARKAINRYSRQLQKHMEIEESLLFPKTIKCLANKDWKTIGARMEKVDDPLFGQTVDSDYRALYEFFSHRSENVTRNLMRFGFLQFDNYIVSADALEHGIGEICDLLSQHAGSFMDETKSTIRGVKDNPRLGSVVDAQWRYAMFLGKQSFNFSKDAAGIYLKTARHIASPFLGGKSTDSRDLTAR